MKIWELPLEIVTVPLLKRLLGIFKNNKKDFSDNSYGIS